MYEESANLAILEAEFRTAFQGTSNEDIFAWATRVPAHAMSATLGRISSVAGLVQSASRVISDERKTMASGIRELGLVATMKRAASRLDNARKDATDRSIETCTNLTARICRNPREEAPRLAALVLGFSFGSGGVDGDGGLADLDLLAGIGAHRSIATHSIFIGILAECLILSFVDLTRTVHQNLPEPHDPRWDRWLNANETVLEGLCKGMSAGLAYHLGVDATLDAGGTYKDLPVSVPQEVHEAILAVNAGTEGTDAAKRESRIFATVYWNHEDARKAMRSLPPLGAKLTGNRDEGWRIIPKSG